MPKYIDADNLKTILEERRDIVTKSYGDLGGAVSGCIKLLDQQPAADVEPKRKPGRWIKLSSADDGYCSECGFAFLASQDGEPPMFGDGFNRREERWSCYPGITSAQNLLKICPYCGSPMLPEPPKEEDDGKN